MTDTPVKKVADAPEPEPAPEPKGPGPDDAIVITSMQEESK